MALAVLIFSEGFVDLIIISNLIGNFSKRSDRIQTQLYAQGFSQDIDEVVIHI